MAYAGQTIENPISGEKITFTRTAADTDGELLAFDMTLSVDGHVPGAHVHPSQEERFEIVSGTIKFRMNGKKIVAGPGDIVTVPPGARHKFANGGDEPVEVRVEVRPALKMEDLLENTVALAKEGAGRGVVLPRSARRRLVTRRRRSPAAGAAATPGAGSSAPRPRRRT